MRILETKNNYNYTKPQTPQFKAWRRLVLDMNQPYVIGGKPKQMNNTLFFRDKKVWEEKIPKILEKYKDTLKINCYNLACSDGSEPLSLAMLVKTKFKDFIEKLLPIKASDFDPEAIERALNRIYELGHFERKSIDKFTNNDFKTYFEETKEPEQGLIEINSDGFVVNRDLKTVSIESGNTDVDKKWYKLKPELYNDVHFHTGDALKEYKNIEHKDSFVMARNFWPYLSDEDKIRLAFRLSGRMKQNCTLMIGEFDLENRWSDLDITKLLKQAKFKPTDDPTIFEK